MIKDRIAHYIECRQRRKEGKYNGIPMFKTFPKLSEVVPSLLRGKQYLFTGSSGIGKSNCWRGILIYTLYHLIIIQENIKFKVIIFLLEDTKEDFIDSLFSMIYKLKFNKIVAKTDLEAVKSTLIDDTTMQQLEEVGKEVQKILNFCIIEDSITNPTGLYKYCRNESEQLGKHIWEDRNFTYSKDDGTKSSENTKVYKEYIPYDKELQVLVIVDNLNNLARESGLNQIETIDKWTRDYGRMQIAKHYGWTIWDIHQQASMGESQQYDYKGHNIIDKVKPSLSDLGKSILQKYCVPSMQYKI